MATKDRDGQITETPGEATQAENSKNSFVVLIVSMVAIVIIGVGLFWYLDVFPIAHAPPPHG